jgi:hypothetical protein
MRVDREGTSRFRVEPDGIALATDASDGIGR